ncbi:unnamed protein product, partial [Nesidiocoris tenuis]
MMRRLRILRRTKIRRRVRIVGGRGRNKIRRKARIIRWGEGGGRGKEGGGG